MSKESEELVRAYTLYRARRKEIQQRLREQLEQELYSEKRVLGEAVVKLQKSGTRITDMPAIITNKNRNFLYDMRKVYLDHETLVNTESAVTKPGEPEMPSYNINMRDKDHVMVNIYGVGIFPMNKVGDQFMPHDDWASLSQYRNLFRKILGELNGAVE